ncbi:MAG: hypothetical protein ABSH35_05880 [Isosphaeraceae bacterium]|jgi:hypothetical protein
MIHAFSSRRRGGYSLTVVLLFLVLLLFLWAAVYRTTASFLRVETARVKRNDLDEGMLGALGKALWYLETNPALPRNPVTYGITVPVSPQNPEGPNFTATFTPATPPSGWTIQVTPGTYSTPLPGS